jgi:hypothetical protein
VNAVTLRQPQADAVLARPGPFTLPCWQTSHRGPLLIHAARRESSDPLPVASRGPAYAALLGVVDLVDCVERAGADADPDEAGFVWVLANPRPFVRPVPHSGRVGLFAVADALVADAIAELPPPRPARRTARPRKAAAR